MAKKLYEESNIQAIADAIRTKNGTTNTYTTAEMAAAISAITSGGGGADLPEEALTISGYCDYKFYCGGWDWFIERYGDKITTNNIDTGTYMFFGSNITEIPFDINFRNGGGHVNDMFCSTAKLESIPPIDFKQTSPKNCKEMFKNCKAKEIGAISNLYPESTAEMFSGCHYIRHMPDFINLNVEKIATYRYSDISDMFYNCYSLREIPSNFLKQLKQDAATGGSYSFYSGGFNGCLSLDALYDLPVSSAATVTSNMFSNTFSSCKRLKDIVFEMNDDGTAKTANWKSQTIDLTASVGYEIAGTAGHSITRYNSGITIDKLVTDDATYQALKDDPDWFAGAVAYSRYNHDSAVATINSLPDTSGAGGGNIIKFQGSAGSATDGGAINTLTEDEIAVATAKGWTVQIV